MFTAPLLPGLAAGRVDQDAPHGLGRRRKEVSPAVPDPVRVAADQPQVGLMHQGRGLERLTRRLAGQLLSSQAAQLVVDQREQRAGRLPLPPVVGFEDTRDFTFTAIDRNLLDVGRGMSSSRIGITSGGHTTPSWTRDGQSPRSYPVGCREATGRLF